jgi:2-haloacid dehalogenase
MLDQNGPPAPAPRRDGLDIGDRNARPRSAGTVPRRGRDRKEARVKLSEFKVLTFDCYGTLIDWESGMIAALRPLTDRLVQVPARNAILEAHGRIEATQQLATPAKPYRELLAVVYKRLAESWGLSVSWQECLTYGRSVADWPAFPDSSDALRYLKQHCRLVILSNVDNESFAHSNGRLGVAFDGVYTAEDIGSYKPALRNFEYMVGDLARQGLAARSILHVAESLFHDHVPANRMGLASCWIHRRHADEGYGATQPPGVMPRIDFRFTSMGELAAAYAADLAG